MDKATNQYRPMTPNQVWTRRWVELRHHEEQLRLWNDEHRFKIIPAARRSGKTELAKRRLSEHLFRRTYHGGKGRYFAAAPTREQAKRIWWEDLKALVPRQWRRVSEGQMMIATKLAELWVVGLDKPERIEGSPWDGCCIDEFANCKPGMWDANIRPALADRRGWAWLLGVPDRESPAQVEYKRMYEMARDGIDPEWAAFHWPSADIIHPDEVESARRRMDPDLFAQEFEGKFVLAGGVAFPTFEYKTHVSDAAVYDPALPLNLACDFNVNPMCWGVLQHHKGEVRVIREMVIHDSSTDVACDAFMDLVDKEKWNAVNLRVYGDASGSARDTTSGTSDWAIIRNRLKNLSPVIKVPAANAPIKDTLNAVRAKLRAADGTVGLKIHPSCGRLIKDFGELLWPSDLEEGHCMAWLRYFINWEYPVMGLRFTSGRIGST